MRLKTVGKLGGIESLVLDAPGEDDGGQRVNQLLPENKNEISEFDKGKGEDEIGVTEF